MELPKSDAETVQNAGPRPLLFMRGMIKARVYSKAIRCPVHAVTTHSCVTGCVLACGDPADASVPSREVGGG